MSLIHVGPSMLEESFECDHHPLKPSGDVMNSDMCDRDYLKRQKKKGAILTKIVRGMLRKKKSTEFKGLPLINCPVSDTCNSPFSSKPEDFDLPLSETNKEAPVALQQNSLIDVMVESNIPFENATKDESTAACTPQNQRNRSNMEETETDMKENSDCSPIQSNLFQTVIKEVMVHPITPQSDLKLEEVNETSMAEYLEHLSVQQCLEDIQKLEMTAIKMANRHMEIEFSEKEILTKRELFPEEEEVDNEQETHIEETSKPTVITPQPETHKGVSILCLNGDQIQSEICQTSAPSLYKKGFGENTGISLANKLDLNDLWDAAVDIIGALTSDKPIAKTRPASTCVDESLLLEQSEQVKEALNKHQQETNAMDQAVNEVRCVINTRALKKADGGANTVPIKSDGQETGTELQYKTPTRILARQQTTVVLPNANKAYCEVVSASPLTAYGSKLDSSLNDSDIFNFDESPAKAFNSKSFTAQACFASFEPFDLFGGNIVMPSAKENFFSEVGSCSLMDTSGTYPVEDIFKCDVSEDAKGYKPNLAFAEKISEPISEIGQSSFNFSTSTKEKVNAMNPSFAPFSPSNISVSENLIEQPSFRSNASVAKEESRLVISPLASFLPDQNQNRNQIEHPNESFRSSREEDGDTAGVPFAAVECSNLALENQLGQKSSFEENIGADMTFEAIASISRSEELDKVLVISFSSCSSGDITAVHQNTEAIVSPRKDVDERNEKEELSESFPSPVWNGNKVLHEVSSSDYRENEKSPNPVLSDAAELLATLQTLSFHERPLMKEVKHNLGGLKQDVQEMLQNMKDECVEKMETNMTIFSPQAPKKISTSNISRKNEGDSCDADEAMPSVLSQAPGCAKNGSTSLTTSKNTAKSAANPILQFSPLGVMEYPQDEVLWDVSQKIQTKGTVLGLGDRNKGLVSKTSKAEEGVKVNSTIEAPLTISERISQLQKNFVG